MLFTAYEFIFLFWPLTLILFLKIKKMNQAKLATLWLVAASFFFYGWWNPVYLLLLLVSIGINYSVGSWLSKGEKLSEGEKLSISEQLSTSAEVSPAIRKGLFGLGIAINLALLGYFKYANFFAANIDALPGISLSLENILLPLGISFFTFQQVAYLADAYAQKTQGYRFLDYCLFVSFFPQLIAGPIVHHKDMMGQFSQLAQVSPEQLRPSKDEDLAVGLTMFSMGLFKKVMLADTMATFATPIFNAAATGTVLSFWDGWIGALAYTLQLYFDFSGYSDMAIGIARTFGIKLPLNFNSPYKADSIADFWRRWHITLSHFLRDYLYIPLGGSRQGDMARYRNLLITMTLGGLWHGAGWTFVMWGSLHGLYLVSHRLWAQGCESLLGRTRLLRRPFSVIITFVAVVISWVFFRAETLTAALSMLSSMFGLRGISLSQALATKLGFLSAVGVRFEGLSSQNFVTVNALIWIVVLLAAVWCLPNTQQWMSLDQPSRHFKDNWTKSTGVSQKHTWASLRWRPSMLWATFYVVLSLCTVLSLSKESEFIYFQF